DGFDEIRAGAAGHDTKGPGTRLDRRGSSEDATRAGLENRWTNKCRSDSRGKRTFGALEGPIGCRYRAPCGRIVVEIEKSLDQPLAKDCCWQACQEKGEEARRQSLSHSHDLLLRAASLKGGTTRAGTEQKDNYLAGGLDGGVYFATWRSVCPILSDELDPDQNTLGNTIFRSY
ncbi:MAG: hypothetical protein OES12_06320, partial [Anaerolineae bacterium]|nr:hypothetical protein [Anaerolineae bacterium]